MMKLSKIINGFLLIAFSLIVVLSCNDDDDLYKQLGENPKNITEIASENAELSALYSALVQVGLDTMLRTEKTFTVFAPDNSAFSGADLSSLSDEELKNVLLNHVLSTTTADFTANMATGYLKTLAPGPDDTNLSFFTNKAESLSFNGMGSIVSGMSDIGATNGIIHIIDGVLIPPTVVDHAKANPDYTSFADAIEKADLASVLNGAGPFTVFAPNNAAFEALIAEVNGAFGWETLDDIPVEFLEEIILFHVVASENLLAADTDETTQTTMQGESFAVAGTALDDASYEDASIVLTDIQGVNGIMHGIDKVLLPEDIFQSILSATINMVERCQDKGYTTFLEAVEKAGLTASLAADELTAFAPNNDAFVALFIDMNNFDSLADFDTPEEIELLKDLIEYQLYAGKLMAGDLTDGSSVTTIYGDSFTVDLGGDDPKLRPSFEDAIPSTIVNANIGATNGVIHETNRVLVSIDMLDALGIETGGCDGAHPVGDPNLVFFDWDANGPWWGNVQAENDPAISLDGGNYGRINMQTGTTGWLDLFWRNGSTMNGQNTVGANINDYVLKFDINVMEPINAGKFRIRFHDGDGVDAFYDWAPWVDTGEPYSTDGWTTVEIPLAVLGVSDFSLIDQEFGMAWDGADILLNFAMDNVRFDAPGYSCGGPDPVADPDLVFYDWDANGSWWGNVQSENDPAITIDGSNYGRANFQTGGTGWTDLFWRNGSTMNGQNTVGANINDYVLKFDIWVMEPIPAGRFRIRFHDGDGVDAFYDWAPWKDTGEPYSTDGWVTIEIPLAVLGVPDFSLIDQEFGMAWDEADVLLNFAIDNVRFEAL